MFTKEAIGGMVGQLLRKMKKPQNRMIKSDCWSYAYTCSYAKLIVITTSKVQHTTQSVHVKYLENSQFFEVDQYPL